MSQREKRLIKKVKELSLLSIEKEKALDYIVQLEQEIHRVQHFLEDIEGQENFVKNYVNKNKDSNMFLAKHELVDGTELEVIVAKEGRTVIVSSMGLIGKAKAHEDESFVFEIGYQLALNRLIEQYLNLLCEFNMNNRED
jgi:hypothetical protein